MSTIPDWRAGAPAGISLSAAMTRVGAEKVRGGLPAELLRIIRPEAAPRWRSARVSQFTPQYVEWTLANALAGDLVAQWEMFDLMEETWPRLAKNLGEIKRQVAAMKWSVQAWSEEDAAPPAEAEERARLVSHVIWRMRPDAARGERDFGGVVYDLLDAWGKGVSLVELIWEERKVPGLGSKAVLRAGEWVHPNNYGVAEDGSIGLRLDPEQGMVHRGSAVRELPPYKFLVGIARAKSSHFIGAALLRPLAWWWAAANFAAEWMLNYAQVFGVPLRWANYPEGAGDALINKIGDMLTNLGSAGWAAFPEGTSLNLHEGTKTAGSSPQEGILDRADKQCDLLVLGQTLTTDAADRGTQALGTVHERVRGDVIQSAADWVAGVMTQQLVPMILELNYGDTEWAPELEAEPVREEDWKGMAERDAILLAAGVRMPWDWFLDRHDIPIPREGEETVGGDSPSPIADGQGAKTPQDEPEPPGGSPDTTEAGKARIEERHDTAGGRGKLGGEPRDPAAAVADLVRQAVAEAAGVRTRWLEPLAQELDRLIEAARDDRMSDDELRLFLLQAQRNLPDLFGQLDIGALSDHLEAYLGAATVRGVKAQVG